MKYIQKKAWPLWGMTFLALLLSVLIAIASNKNQNLLWLLVISIPLFLIVTYFAWKTGHLLQKYSTDSLQFSEQDNHIEWLSHSVYPTKIASADLKVQIGNDQCSQPYSACIFNVDSMKNCDQEIFNDAPQERGPEYSKGSVNERLETYPLTAGGLVWQIGPGYIGCRTEIGHFNSKAFKKIAGRQEVKMIELKLSSVNNTNHLVDSFLEFAETLDGKMSNSLFSGSAFTTFSDAEGMIHFLCNLRELSDGKPIGIRICINDKKEFYQICYAIRKTQIIPDFIVVEGTFDRTDIVYFDQTIDNAMDLYDAVMFVSQTLQMYGLENKIKIIADGRIISCFDILKILALGANMICTEMPRYRIMKYPGDGQKVSFQLRSQNLYEYHNNLMNDTIQIMKVFGFRSIKDITLSKVISRLDVVHPKNFAKQNDPVSYSGAVQKVYN